MDKPKATGCYGQNRGDPLRWIGYARQDENRETGDERRENPIGIQTRHPRRAITAQHKQHCGAKDRWQCQAGELPVLRVGGAVQRQREPSEQVSGFQQRAQQGDCDPNKLAVGRQRLDVLPLGPEARERRKASDRANQNAETGKHDRAPPWPAGREGLGFY